MRLFIGLLAIVSMMGGCGWSIPGLPANQPDRKFTHSEREVHEPVVVQVVDGKAIIGERSERTYNVGLDQHVPPKTFFQKVREIVWGVLLLVLMAVIVWTVACKYFPWLSTLFGFVNTRINKQMSQIVKSVDKGLEKLPEAQKEIFKGEMGKVQDVETKAAVDEVQMENTKKENS